MYKSAVLCTLYGATDQFLQTVNNFIGQAESFLFPLKAILGSKKCHLILALANFKFILKQVAQLHLMLYSYWIPLEVLAVTILK